MEEENVYYVAYGVAGAKRFGVTIPDEGESIDVFYQSQRGKIEICEGPDFGECVDEIARATALRLLQAESLRSGDVLNPNVGIITVDSDTHTVLFRAEETHAVYLETFMVITTSRDMGPLHGDYVCEAEAPHGLLCRVGDYNLF